MFGVRENPKIRPQIRQYNGIQTDKEVQKATYECKITAHALIFFAVWN